MSKMPPLWMLVNAVLVMAGYLAWREHLHALTLALALAWPPVILIELFMFWRKWRAGNAAWWL
jgi:hypothetical protein